MAISAMGRGAPGAPIVLAWQAPRPRLQSWGGRGCSRGVAFCFCHRRALHGRRIPGSDCWWMVLWEGRAITLTSSGSRSHLRSASDLQHRLVRTLYWHAIDDRARLDQLRDPRLDWARTSVQRVSRL